MNAFNHTTESSFPWQLPACPSCWQRSDRMVVAFERDMMADCSVGALTCSCGYRVYFKTAPAAFYNNRLIQQWVSDTRWDNNKTILTDAGSVLKRLCKPYVRNYGTPFFSH